MALFLALALSCQGLPSIQPAPTNRAPAVSIVWPKSGDRFSAGTLVKIKTQSSDSDGEIARVLFYAGTNVIGQATNPPFNALWFVGVLGAPYGAWNLKAVAVDNLGATNESASVTASYYTGGPPEPVVEIISPGNGTVFAAPATFDISAEVLASTGDTGPIEYFVGTNSVGIFDQVTNFTATTPPSSTTVTNVPEGEYKLAVRYMGGNGVYCRCDTKTIRVVKLGVQLPVVTAEGRMQFEVVTSYPNKPNIIETSLNLRHWTPINTNWPATSTFPFADTNSICDTQRFYRVRVPPE